MDRSSGNSQRTDPEAISVDVRNAAIVLETQWNAVSAEVWDAWLGSSAKYFYIPNIAAAHFSDHRPDVPWQLVAVGISAATHHADSTNMDWGRRGAVGAVLSGVLDYRRADVRDCVRAGAEGRLVIADSSVIAAILLSTIDVHRVVPLGEGSSQRQAGWMERRGTRTTSPHSSAGNGLVQSAVTFLERSAGDFDALIGIGGAVACSPLPHHRTSGSAYGGSVS